MPAGPRVLALVPAPDRAAEAAGTALAGASAALLGELLAAVGVAPADVAVAALVRERPDGHRDPSPAEVARWRPALEADVAARPPVVVVALGAFVTKALRGDPAPIRAVHGRDEVAGIGEVRVRLLPAFHPDAALYAAPVRDALAADLARVPDLLALGPPEQPGVVVAPPADEPPGDAPLTLF